jgi:transglutaminase-like putative cysteine protease
MTWRIAIEHRTTLRYAQEVLASYNEARVTPLALPRQSCLEARVEVHPSTRTHAYADYWGSVVTAFDLHVPHQELVVVGTSVVETSPAPAPALDASWTDLAAPDVVDEYAELLAPTVYAPRLPESVHGAVPRDAARAAVDWVRAQLEYTSGVTDVSTSALEALEHGHGVCQDFAHLTLSVLRGLGIPARYVSGYLHPSADAAVGEVVTGQSHAWVEWWCGDWIAWDPTHGVAVGERHVTVARGRDYADVPPLKGVYQGAATVANDVEVRLTRLG